MHLAQTKRAKTKRVKIPQRKVLNKGIRKPILHLQKSRQSRSVPFHCVTSFFPSLDLSLASIVTSSVSS